MIEIPTNFPKLNYPVVTMGTFDGVHIGHQRLMEKVIERAKEKQGEAIVITYYHHPKEILDESTPPYLLTEKERKTRLLKQLGIDYVLYLNFDHQMSEMSAERFLEDVIIGRIGAKEIVFGYDCHFGYRRAGNYQFLKENEKRYDYIAHIVDPVKIDSQIVSSSLIRSFVRVGDVSEVNKFLGYPYDIEGEVILGEGIGQKLGFPTINILPMDRFKLIPAKGVYLSNTIIGEDKYHSLVNIGNSPTLKETVTPTIESHLLDFTGNLYGKKVTVELLLRIRDEIKFPTREDLIKAISKDVQLANDWFGQEEVNN